MSQIPVTLPKNSPWQIQKLVVFSLLIRESKTRFGKHKAGLIWALLEPIAHITFLSLIFGFIMERTVPAIPYPMFLLLGYVPYGLFTRLISSNLTCFEANQGLLVHQKVKPTDALLARILLETMINSVSFVIFMVVAMFLLEEKPDFSRPLELVGAGLTIILMGSGLGILCSVLGWKHKDLQRVVPLVLRPLIFVSCVIYPLQIVPTKYQDVLLKNPLVHVIETFRVTAYPAYRTTDQISLVYPLLCGVVFLWLGMAYYRANSSALYDAGLG